MPGVRKSGTRSKDQSGAGLRAVRVPMRSEMERGPQDDQGKTSREDVVRAYWRTHTWMNGHEQELDVGMASHVTEKGRVIRYSVGVIK